MKEFLQGFFKKISTKDIGTYAASTAFFLFFSFLPIAILLLLFLPLSGLSTEELIGMTMDVTPDFIDDLVAQIIREAYGRTAVVLPLTMILIIFCAAQGMTALIRGLRFVYDIEKQGNAIFLNLMGIISTLAITVFLVLAALGLVLENAAVRTLTDGEIQVTVFGQFLLRCRYLIMVALFVLLLTLLYTYISGSKRVIRLHIPGAVFSSVACAVFTGLFSFYVNLNPSYRTIYGDLAAFIVMLLWGYICIYLILIGGSLNRYLMDRREQQASPQRSETDEAASAADPGSGKEGVRHKLWRMRRKEEPPEDN